MRFSRKIESCNLSPIRKFHPYAVEAEARGRKIYHLNIGQPDIETPKEFFTAIQNFKDSVLAYAPSAGIPAYVESVRGYYKSLGIELSDQATTLITKVTERQAALTEEEQAAAREKMQELFPVREVVVDGVSYTCYIIDLRIVADGVERIEQYAVSLTEDGQWMFIKL